MGIGLHYRNIWDRYCDEYRCDSTVYNAEIIRDNAKRYLMLMIRPCLFAGAFESYKEQCEAIDLVWSLKYEKSPENFNMLPQSNVTIGLEYDHENECFDYICRIKKRILELDSDRVS